MARASGRGSLSCAKLRGVSQRGLAARAHVSYSLLTKVEQGHRPASPAFIGAVARALRVDVPRITGQPYHAPAGQMRALQATIDPIRRALLTHDLPSEDAPPSSTASNGRATTAGTHYGLEFGPSNVALHAVSAAVEMEDGPKAIERALVHAVASAEARLCERLRAFATWLGLD